jgi:hypothetical protein
VSTPGDRVFTLPESLPGGVGYAAVAVMKSGLRTHSPPARGGEGGSWEKCDDDEADGGEISSVGE